MGGGGRVNEGGEEGKLEVGGRRKGRKGTEEMEEEREIKKKERKGRRKKV